MKKLASDIIKLRKDGLTYNQIKKKLKCSKSSISYTCNKYIKNNKEISRQHFLNADKTDSLRKARLGAKNYFFKLRKEKKKLHLDKIKEYKNQNFIFYIAGIYRGEGNHMGTEFKIANSDLEIISDFIYFIKNVLDLEYSCRLVLHTTHNKPLCLRYWNDNNVEIHFIDQYDNRKQAKDNSYRENYGTVAVRTIKPIGVREAVLEYSVFSR